MQHIWLARLGTLGRTEGLLWVSWARETSVFSNSASYQPALHWEWAGHHNRRATGWFLFFFGSGLATQVSRHRSSTTPTPEAPRLQPWSQQRKHLKDSSSTMKVPSLAVWLESAAVRTDLLGGSQDVEIGLLTWCPEVDKASLGDQERISSLFLLSGYHPWPGTLVLPKLTILLAYPGQQGYSLWPVRLKT